MNPESCTIDEQVDRSVHRQPTELNVTELRQPPRQRGVIGDPGILLTLKLLAGAMHQRRLTTDPVIHLDTTLGVIVAALGIRVLELSLDAAVFAELPRVQQRLFRTTDACTRSPSA